jgi:hypothetical protein
MISKLHLKKIPKKISKLCFKNVCSWAKKSRKKANNTFLKLFLNAMIRNIKIEYILNIIEISKYGT